MTAGRVFPLTKLLVTALVAAAGSLLLSQCASDGVIATAGGNGTPDHNLPKHEYPFDDSGKYREDWVKSPRSGASRRSSSSGSSSSSSQSYKKSTTSRSSSSATSGSSSSKKQMYHTVAKGDTLWGISRRYGRSVTAIKQANGLKSDVIRPGETYRIP